MPLWNQLYFSLLSSLHIYNSISLERVLWVGSHPRQFIFSKISTLRMDLYCVVCCTFFIQFPFSLPIHVQNSLQQQEREEVEKGTVVTAGRRYENRKRDLEQNTHSKQERLQAKQRQGEFNTYCICQLGKLHVVLYWQFIYLNLLTKCVVHLFNRLRWLTVCMI